MPSRRPWRTAEKPVFGQGLNFAAHYKPLENLFFSHSWPIWKWCNWDDFNVDTYQKSSWGSGGGGGRCEPPSGVWGSGPEIFEICGFSSFTSEDLFWQILENFLGVLLQFSANERPVCNMWLFTAQSCVCLDGTPQKLFPTFLVRKSDLHWHRYLLCTFTQSRPWSCWTTSGLSFSSTWTKALHFPTTNRCAFCFAWIFVVPSHDRSCPLVRPQYMYSCFNWGLCFSGFLHWLHGSQKLVLAYDKHGKLAAGVRVQPLDRTWPVSTQSFLCHERLFELFRQKLEFRVHACCSDACSTCHSVTVGLGNCALCWKQFLL